MGGRASEKDCDGLGFSSSLRYSALFVSYNPALICRECAQFRFLPKLAARWCNKCTSFIRFNPSPAEGYDNEHQSHIFPSKPQNFRFHWCIPEHRGKAPAQPGGVPEDQSSRHHSLTSAVHSSSKNAPADKQSLGPKSLLLDVSPLSRTTISALPSPQGAETTSAGQLWKPPPDADLSVNKAAHATGMPREFRTPLRRWKSGFRSFLIASCFLLQRRLQHQGAAGFRGTARVCGPQLGPSPTVSRGTAGVNPDPLTRIRRDSPPPLFAGSSCGASVCRVKPRRSTA